MNDSLYICAIADKCVTPCGAGKPHSDLYKMWGVNTPEEWEPFLCHRLNNGLKAYPTFYNEVSKEEIDDLFKIEFMRVD